MNKILVVGQGLAGTLLSYQLFKNNIDFHVIDNNHFKSSTKVAAGLINPITGRRYVKSWLIDELLPSALQQYSHFEKMLDISIINQQNILRTLKTPKQINMWDEVSTRPGYDAYVVNQPDAAEYLNIIKGVKRFAEIKSSYRIDISLLISTYKSWLQKHDKLTHEIFNYQALKIEEKGVSYNNKSYSHVIFCEGHAALENPYFNKLGFQMAKGEALMLKFDKFNSQKILRDDIFFVPNNEGVFWSGGGYKWQFDTDAKTEEWKSAWIDKIKEVTDQPYAIMSHKAGIRPCVLDRKPLLGRHIKHPQVCIFNGLGTKGTSLGPYFAKHLFDHLFKGKALLEEVNCLRYVK